MIALDYPAFADDFTTVERKEAQQDRVNWNGDTSIETNDCSIARYYYHDQFISTKQQEQGEMNFLDSFSIGLKRLKPFHLVEYYRISKEISLLAERLDLQDQGYKLPNEETIKRANNLVLHLANQDIFPSKVSVSGDDGICLRFVNNTLRFYLELYNDGDSGFIVEDTEKGEPIQNHDLEFYKDSIEYLKEFYA